MPLDPEGAGEGVALARAIEKVAEALDPDEAEVNVDALVANLAAESIRAGVTLDTLWRLLVSWRTLSQRYDRQSDNLVTG
ncbi:MAG: hypothetical protein JSV86_18530 [Gemmatimonadota bacterium]|nr:MAG: hypothetical protein JSV86_18530 [Gemmatimonadota bacterium]